MTERTCTEARFDLIKLTNPSAHIQERNGIEYVVIPMYDFDNDKVFTHEMKLIRGTKNAPKFKPGDTLFHTETGEPFDIVDPLAKILGADKVVKREKPEDGEDSP